jgi:predicted enzyme related to lactoylglutathione lyase
VAFEVDDLDQTVRKLKESGVPFDMDVMDTPVCCMAVVLDPDGSKVMVHKRKGAA